MYWLPFLSAPYVPACRDVINAAQRYEAKCVVIWCNGISMFVHLMRVCHNRAGLRVTRWNDKECFFCHSAVVHRYALNDSQQMSIRDSKAIVITQRAADCHHATAAGSIAGT